jgi:hypothetical protein
MPAWRAAAGPASRRVVGAARKCAAWFAARRRPSLTPLEQFYEDLDVDLLRQRFDEAVKAGKDQPLAASLLLVAATLRTPQFRVSKEKRQLAYRYYEPLALRYSSQNRGPTAVLAPQAVVRLVVEAPRDASAGGRWRKRRWRTGDSAARVLAKTLAISLSPYGAPDFPWSEARSLLNRCDALGDRAKLWVHEVQEQGPHVERAYNLATQVLSAVQRESWRRQQLRIGPEKSPSELFAEELRVMRTEVERAERLFLRSAEQSAQALYFNGMLRGAVGVVLFSAVGGWLLYRAALPAATGVAFPAGALGAAISVMQRMHAGALAVDFRAPPGRLRLFGGIRLVLGAVFGMVVFAILQSGQLPALELPTGTGPALAFFAVLGFLSGFNERFAQDVVTTSTEGLAATIAGGVPGSPHTTPRL